jgi:hypothetical protein
MTLESDMFNDNTNAGVFFPSQLHWTAQELTEAVPLRLHELFAFAAARDGAADCANGRQAPRPPQRNYLPATPAPEVFRVR